MRKSFSGRLVRALGVAAALLGAPRAARAEGISAELGDGVVVDWTAGVLRARGLGVADRRAPNPATARDAAKVRAVADARAQLTVAAKRLPWADAAAEPQLSATALEAAVARAALVEAEPLVDGSWRVELSLPLESLRQAKHGPRVVALVEKKPRAGDKELPLLVVRVPASPASSSLPALGVEIFVGGAALRGATLWTRGDLAGVAVPEAKLARATSVEATASLRPGGVVLLTAPAAGKLTATDATLTVVVLGQ